MEEAAVTGVLVATAVLVVIFAGDGMEVTVVDGMGEAVTGEDMSTPTERMDTPLRLMGMAILITDLGTILPIGTMVITVEGAMVDVDGKQEMVKQTA
jgi:amino acid transporter